MNGIKLIWLMVIGAVALTLAACDSSSSGGGSPNVADGTEYVVFDDDEGGGNLNGLQGDHVELGPDDVLLRIDNQEWVAEDSDGTAQFWGDVEVLPSGFKKMEVTNSKIDDVPEGTELIAFEVDEGVIFVMGTESFDEAEEAFLDDDTVGINFDGSCPANGTQGNNYLTTPDSQGDATTVEIGTASYITSGGSIDVDVESTTIDMDLSGFAGETNQLSNMACDDGVAEDPSDNAIGFQGAGFSIVFPNSGSGALVFPRPSSADITLADGETNGRAYAGIAQSHDGNGDSRISLIGAEGQGSMIYAKPYETLADIQNGDLDLMNGPATINLDESGTFTQYFDNSTIDVADGFPMMVMEMPDGRILVAGIIWTDNDMSSDVDTGDDAEFVLLLEQ